jgi:hypothetical protein
MQALSLVLILMFGRISKGEDNAYMVA